MHKSPHQTFQICVVALISDQFGGGGWTTTMTHRHHGRVAPRARRRFSLQLTIHLHAPGVWVSISHNILKKYSLLIHKFSSSSSSLFSSSSSSSLSILLLLLLLSFPTSHPSSPPLPPSPLIVISISHYSFYSPSLSSPDL